MKSRLHSVAHLMCPQHSRRGLEAVRCFAVQRCRCLPTLHTSNAPATQLPLTVPSLPLQTLSTRLWNLDRMDQRELPLDGKFNYGTGGQQLPAGRSSSTRACLLLETAKRYRQPAAGCWLLAAASLPLSAG